MFNFDFITMILLFLFIFTPKINWDKYLMLE